MFKGSGGLMGRPVLEALAGAAGGTDCCKLCTAKGIGKEVELVLTIAFGLSTFSEPNELFAMSNLVTRPCGFFVSLSAASTVSSEVSLLSATSIGVELVSLGVVILLISTGTSSDGVFGVFGL